MEKSSQDKHRGALIEKYEQRAWECLAMYNYYGRQYAEIEKQINSMEDMVKKCEQQIVELNDKPDKSVDDRAKIKALKKDCDDYENRIKGVGDLAKKFFEKSAAYREEGVRLLEQIEDFKAFNLKTPEQIAEDKKNVESPAEPVVAGDNKCGLV